MKRDVRVFLLTAAAVIVLAAGVLISAAPPPAMAQTGTCPVIDAVQPDEMLNSVDTTLLITGTGFEGVETALLVGYSSLVIDTTRTDELLRVTVPSGVPANRDGYTYTLRLVEPGCDREETTITVKAPRPTEAPEPTDTPEPTSTPEPTATIAPTEFIRPVLSIASYGASSERLVPGTDIDFELTIQNNGQIRATNVVITFVAGNLIPRATGGVRAVGNMPSGSAYRLFQPFTVDPDMSGEVATLQVEAAYTDTYGNSYEETFSLSFPAVELSDAPTETPTPGLRPRLVIQDYTADVDRLLPGTLFTLTLDLHNLGATDARDVTMIVGGGGALPSTGNGDATSSDGGIGGASGEFSTFAPIGSSNIQFLDDLAMGASRTVTQRLVVNVSADPGAYPLTVSFVYGDSAGETYTDEQVISLLVYTVPQIEASFYREPDPFMVGQPGLLPIQLTNLAREDIVLGNMEVTAEGGEVTNGTVLVGLIDADGFYTIDATLLPTEPGVLPVTVTLNYRDDFGEQQAISQTLTVVVEDVPPVEEPSDGMPDEMSTSAPETTLQKIGRAIRGLLGLDSARREEQPAMPVEGMPPEGVTPGGGDGGEIVVPEE